MKVQHLDGCQHPWILLLWIAQTSFYYWYQYQSGWCPGEAWGPGGSSAAQARVGKAGRLKTRRPLPAALPVMRTEPPLRTFLRTFVSTNGRRRPSYAPFFYFGVLFIAREGKCGAKRREKFDCWACQHQFLVNNNHSKARCTQELLLLRLKSLLLLCVLAGWFLQERKEREANEQQQREAPRKIPRCVSCVTSISGRTTSKQSTTSAKRNMTSCLDRMTSSKQSTTSSKQSTTS